MFYSIGFRTAPVYADDQLQNPADMISCSSTDGRPVLFLEETDAWQDIEDFFADCWNAEIDVDLLWIAVPADRISADVVIAECGLED